MQEYTYKLGFIPIPTLPAPASFRRCAKLWKTPMVAGKTKKHQRQQLQTARHQSNFGCQWPWGGIKTRLQSGAWSAYMRLFLCLFQPSRLEYLPYVLVHLCSIPKPSNQGSSLLPIAPYHLCFGNQPEGHSNSSLRKIHGR